MNSEHRMILRQCARLSVPHTFRISPKRRKRAMSHLLRRGYFTVTRTGTGAHRRNVYTLTAKGLHAAYLTGRRASRSPNIQRIVDPSAAYEVRRLRQLDLQRV